MSVLCEFEALRNATEHMIAVGREKFNGKGLGWPGAWLAYRGRGKHMLDPHNWRRTRHSTEARRNGRPSRSHGDDRWSSGSIRFLAQVHDLQLVYLSATDRGEKRQHLLRAPPLLASHGHIVNSRSPIELASIITYPYGFDHDQVHGKKPARPGYLRRIVDATVGHAVLVRLSRAALVLASVPHRSMSSTSECRP